MKPRWSSRKFIVAVCQWVAILFLPPIYKILGIENDLTMVVLTMSSAVSGLYLGVNVIESKKDGSS